MWDLALLAGGVVLLVAAINMLQRKRERDLLARIDRAGSDPHLAAAEMDRAIQAEKERKEFWRRQNPRGLR